MIGTIIEIVKQYLPDQIAEERFYEPDGIGYEHRIKERLRRLREREGDV